MIVGKPILWHIMKNYSFYGHNDFIILLGYKGYYIKEYFAKELQQDVIFLFSDYEKDIDNPHSDYSMNINQLKQYLSEFFENKNRVEV